ncbi:MAG: hypothetical protein Q8J99_11600 [Sulfuritalea sp.]|nr:hypothetical protein [Sulfuritalea sp.]
MSKSPSESQLEVARQAKPKRLDSGQLTEQGRGNVMTDPHPSQPFHTGKVYRLLTAGFGLFLSGVGLYAIFFADTATAVRYAGGAVLVLAAYNMVSAACRAKESWLSRLGPLP